MSFLRPTSLSRMVRVTSFLDLSPRRLGNVRRYFLNGKGVRDWRSAGHVANNKGVELTRKNRIKGCSTTAIKTHLCRGKYRFGRTCKCEKSVWAFAINARAIGRKKWGDFIGLLHRSTFLKQTKRVFVAVEGGWRCGYSLYRKSKGRRKSGCSHDGRKDNVTSPFLPSVDSTMVLWN